MLFTRSALAKVMPTPRRLTHGLAVLGLASGLVLVPAMLAAGPVGVVPTVLLQDKAPMADRVADDTAPLMLGLIRIESDLLLGMLFLKDGMTSADEPFFSRPRQGAFAEIKAGLTAAGAPDLEPLLVALEGAKDKDAIALAYNGVLQGLKDARAALAPTDHDILAAVMLAAEDAKTYLDPSGTTEVAAYQEAWGLLTTARRKLDALTTSSDPATRKASEKMALAFDDVILFAPDPAATAPVAFDPALVTQLIDTLKGQQTSL